MKEPILFPSSDSLPATPPECIDALPGQKRFTFHALTEGERTIELRFHAAKDSVLESVVLQDVPKGQSVRIRIRAIAESGATLKLLCIQRGSSKSSVELFSEAAGKGARLELRGLNVAHDGQQLHLIAESRHPVASTSSDLQVWNAALGESRTLFSGLIRIEPGARQTEAFQKNRNLILSERAVIDSIPKLLIANDDVKCAHGSSTSSLDLEQEMYLRSRGLDRLEAEQMLVRGFIAQAMDGVGDLGCREDLAQRFGLDSNAWNLGDQA
jgi:Fe-S cluster assembly protein SufD